jgi:type II secretory pathway component PulF
MPKYNFANIEEGERWDAALKIVAGQMKRKNELESRLKKIIIQPVIVVASAIILVSAVLVVIAPQLVQTSKLMGIELSPTVSLIISTGNFMAKNWFWLFLSISGILLMLYTAFQIKRAKRTMDAIVLRIPAVSEIAKKTNSCHLMRTLSFLLEADVPVARCLEMSSGIPANLCFGRVAETASQKAREGSNFIEALKDYENLFPSLSLQMIEDGQRNGETSAVLADLADFFEEKAITEAKNLSVLIESVLMLFLGGAVGFLAVSAIQPFYSLLQILR